MVLSLQACCCSSTAAPEATRQALLILPVASPEEWLLHAQVFCYKGSAAHEEMRSACFDYLRLGGWYSAGPVSLLSGLNPRPSVLVMHFFAVAVFGVGRLLMPRPTLRCLSACCASFSIARCQKHQLLRALLSDKVSQTTCPSSVLRLATGLCRDLASYRSYASPRRADVEKQGGAKQHCVGAGECGWACCCCGVQPVL